MDEKRSPSELEAAVEAACEEYYDKNAQWTVMGLPFDEDEKRHALHIMKSMYMCWLGQYNPGHFVNELLKYDFMEVINRADETNRRCLKLYAWFKHNKMNKGIEYYDS